MNVSEFFVFSLNTSIPGFSFYFLIVAISILAILGGRAGHFELKVRKYLQKNHPEKAKDFGCKKGGWFNEFKLISALYEEDDIDDPEFVQLKNKARNAQTLGFLTLLLVTFVIVIYLLYLIFFGPKKWI